jgi:prolyl oligopeptidase
MTHHNWSRRDAIGALGAVPLAGVLGPFSSPFARTLADGPPVARVEAVAEEMWGETIVDPYRWMENSKDPDWEPFMRGQADYTRSVLDRIPGREKLLDRISQLSKVTALMRNVQSTANRVFYDMQPSGAEGFKLFFRQGLESAERLLVDPTTVKESGTHFSLDWWNASPNGRYVAYGLSAAGSEMSTLHVIDVDSGKILPEHIDRTPFARPSWLPDSTAFFFNRLAEGAKPGSSDLYLDSIVWLHQLNTDPKDDLKILARGQYEDFPMEPTDFPHVITDHVSDHVLARLWRIRREHRYHTAPLQGVLDGKPRWRKVCDVTDEIVDTGFAGDTLYLLTTKDAPNGKVLRTRIAEPSLSDATIAITESDVVIDAIKVSKDALYVQCMNGGYGSLRRVAASGDVTPVPLPYEGAIRTLVTNTQENGAWVVGTSWLLPYTVFRVPAEGKVQDAGFSPPPTINLSSFRAIHAFATARDGTRVPLSILARKGLKRDGRNPALVSAYGSYQIVNDPRFDPRAVAFLELGGVLATAHVRGGGEFGKRWWKAGQKLNKPNTWHDLIDCCKTLVKEGWTSQRTLAIQGRSAGGITVGRALTEQPDMFAAVISSVGDSNALRSEFGESGPINIDEFGTVKERDGFMGLKNMDAMHAVRDGVAYPAVMLTTGMTDPRVDPWSPAKMAARLQKANASKNPVLLRVTFDAGHGFGSTRTQIDEERADEYAFVLWRAGHHAFQPKST